MLDFEQMFIQLEWITSMDIQGCIPEMSIVSEVAVAIWKYKEEKYSFVFSLAFPTLLD